jgi:hypothetical protein
MVHASRAAAQPAWARPVYQATVLGLVAIVIRALGGLQTIDDA